jgi:hypothetical protein
VTSTTGTFNIYRDNRSKQVSDKVRIINLTHPRVILLMDVYGLKR